MCTWFHSISLLNELKQLFNPLNPDDETLDTRRVSYRDRLDNEYWLLQKIHDLLQRANFTELPRHLLLDKSILHHHSSLSSTLNIKINGYDYDVLKFSPPLPVLTNFHFEVFFTILL